MRLGELLKQQGAVDTETCDLVVERLIVDGERIGEALLKRGFIAAGQLRDALCIQFKLDSFAQYQSVVDMDLVKTQLNFAYIDRAVAIALSAKQLTIAALDPSDVAVIDALRRHINATQPLKLVLATASELSALLPNTASISAQSETDDLLQLAEELMQDAVSLSASDIHLEPGESSLRVRYRIDGVLQRRRLFNAELGHRLVEVFKVQLGIDIARPWSAQDGRLQRTFAGRRVDFRASTLPCLYGDALVMRILDRERDSFSLDNIGLSQSWQYRLQPLAQLPDGLILVIGPTGSGKSTTLHALLSEVNSDERAVMSLEDPVEYVIPGVRQTPVQAAQGLDFAEGLRAMLRQDPDVILLGEIRDASTAQVAVSAARTGHLLFSTLHASRIDDLPSRLAELGIAFEQMLGVIRAVLSQRLVRKLCQNCRGQGCESCRDIGYLGRTPILEWLYCHENSQPTQSWEAFTRQAERIEFADEARILLHSGITDEKELDRNLGTSWKYA